MTEPIYTYDQDSDILYVSFSPGKKGTGIELNDHILLRLNKAERRAIGLTLLDYSVLAQRTELGPRSFPLTGLSELSDELRQLVLEIITMPPVNEILTLSAYTPSLAETIPIGSVRVQSHLAGAPLARAA
jgi:uncharacterized protein YuzE